MTKNRFNTFRNFYRRMAELGFTENEADQLRRIELTLQRWGERECNGEVETDENGKAFAVWTGTGERAYRVPNREAGALRRLERIMARHSDLWSYYQTDPRGCALYVGRRVELVPHMDLDAQYSSRGFAVCL